MANFRTHVLGAAIVATIGAITVINADLVSPGAALLCASLGTLGGILPDIDADQSLPTRFIFSALGIAAAVATTVTLYGTQPPALVAVTAIVALLLVSVGLRALSNKLCVHRGLVHSIPSAALCGAATASLATRLFDIGPLHSWLYGTFICAGFIVHLVLDELSSVDLVNARIRRSFGTALKVGVRTSPLRCALVCAVTFGLVGAGPPTGPLIRRLMAIFS